MRDGLSDEELSGSDHDCVDACMHAWMIDVMEVCSHVDRFMDFVATKLNQLTLNLTIGAGF